MRLGLLMWGFLGCGGTAPEEDTSSADTSAPAEAYDGELVPWADKTEAQRIVYMSIVFTPLMREKFQAFDPVAYADFDCATCHRDPLGGDYGMPNAYLTPLPEDDFPTRDDPDPEVAAFVAFMVDEIYPAVPELLGLELHDEVTNPDGFNCHTCHPH